MADEKINKTPEEVLKNSPKYPERAMEEDGKEALMAGVYSGPRSPEMGAVYMGPPDAISPMTQMAYMGPGSTQMPSGFVTFAGLEHIKMGTDPSAISKDNTPDPQSKFCENCGAKNPRSGKFCMECGAQFRK